MTLSLRAATVLGLVAAFFSASVYAADDVPQPEAKEKTSIMRASQLINMSVQNKAGENIGTVNDIVLDGKGQVRYLAIQFGSTFGFGGKLFAVPFQAVQFRFDGNSNTHYLSFDVSKEQLESAPGFASDKWPDFGDARFTSTVDKYYESRSARPGVKVEVRPGTRVPEKR